MFRKAFAIIGILSATFTLAAGAVPIGGEYRAGIGPEPCTAVQGQMFIDGGRYEQAIREFECVIVEQPTDVEGYRGRVEAELLLGRYSDAVHDYQRMMAYVLPVHP